MIAELGRQRIDGGQGFVFVSTVIGQQRHTSITRERQFMTVPRLVVVLYPLAMSHFG